MNKAYTPTVRRNGENGSQFIQTTLRIPPHIYQAVCEAAEKAGRSIHAELLLAVTQSLGIAPELKDGSVLQSIADDLRVLRELAQQHIVKATDQEGGAK